MDKILSIISLNENMLQAIVYTILHSIWQFSIIALFMSLAFRKYKSSKASYRYNIAFGSLIFAFIISMLTFLYYLGGNSIILTETFNITQSISNTQHIVIDKSTSTLIQEWIFSNKYLIFVIWSIGVLIYLIKFIFSLGYVEFLSKTSKPIAHLKAYQKVHQHFNISKNVKIGESTYISSPMILGLLKPVILFPFGIVNQLDNDEVEAILAHEFAHYIRKDIYLNIIQSLIEILFYYHPAIWWISTNIKIERENCCDDLAIQYLGDNIRYAKTLVKMQELQQSILSPTLAMNFSNNNNFFINRIKRILNMANTRNYLKEKIITSIFLLLIVMVFSKNLTGSDSNKSLNNDPTSENIEKEVIIFERDTIPYQKESIRIQKKTNDKDIKISMEDGEVTDLEVNGKKIDSKDYEKYQDIISEVKPSNKNKGQARMYFFGDENEDGNFDFSFGNGINMDSLIKGFPGFDGMKGFDNFDFQNGDWAKNMQKLKDQLGAMQFNFDGMDTSFQFDFAFPEMREWNPNLKLFKEGDTYGDPFGEFPNDMFGPEFRKKNNNFSDNLGNALNRDGFLIPGEENTVELTGKYLKINGEKQPTNIWQKYKRIFEEESGTTLQKNSRLEFKFEGKEAKRKYRVY